MNSAAVGLIAVSWFIAGFSAAYLLSFLGSAFKRWREKNQLRHDIKEAIKVHRTLMEKGLSNE